MNDLIRPNRRALLAFGLVLPAAACARLLPGGGPPPQLFTLTPKSTFDANLPVVDWQLVVEEPEAAGGLQVQSIALRTNALELQYFANARWTDRAPRMVQTLLVESFENSRRIIAVGRQAIGLRSDFNLRTELREFQAEYENPDKPPLVRIRLNAKIVKQPRREIIASDNFEATTRATGTGIVDVVQAFDDALGKVTRRLVEWTILGADQARPAVPRAQQPS